MRQDEAEEHRILFFETPAEVCGALPAKGHPPLVADKPGEMSAGIAVNPATGRMEKAPQLKEDAGRVEEGMTMGAVDGDPLLVACYTVTTESTEKPRSSRPLPLRIHHFLACPAFASHFPQELEGSAAGLLKVSWRCHIRNHRYNSPASVNPEFFLLCPPRIKSEYGLNHLRNSKDLWLDINLQPAVGDGLRRNRPDCRDFHLG